MADGFDLSYDDYRNFIKYCEESKTSFGIIEYINARIKKYTKDNPDFITTLMEEIERIYPRIQYDYTDEDNYINEDAFYRREILDFKRECKDIDSPRLKFLYSYLCFLSAEEKEVDKILGIEEVGRPVETDRTFNTGLSNERLGEIFIFLTQNGFLEKKARDSFINIFSNQMLIEIEPIKWLALYRNGVDMTSLFELIKHLCKWEYQKVTRKSFFYNKVNNCFIRVDGREFSENNISVSYSRWINGDDTKDLLIKRDYKKMAFLLVNYLKEILP